MMRSFASIFCVLLLASQLLHGQYQLDTLMSYTAGPGITYSKIREASGPNLIYVLETDLRNPYVKMQTAKAKNLKVGLERPSVMAAREEAPGHHVVGIVNADFFVDNAPDNMQVIKGEITRKQRNGYSAVAFDTSKHYMLAYPVFKGSILTKGAPITIDSVDEATRGANQLIIYNSYYGPATPASAAGTEVVLAPIDEWFVNDTVHCIVQTIAQTTGGTPIGKGQLVLSASGTRAALVNANIKAGDTVGVYVEVSAGPKKIKELVGGRPIFFKNGAVDSSVASISVVAARNPRTLVGFSKDSSKCYIFVIDGRQAVSVGMDIYEMSRLMAQLKVYHAMNFDGGGSAAMLVNGALVNSPSDGSERSVSNALMVISTEPMPEPVSIDIVPAAVKVFRGRDYQFALSALDRYRNRPQLNAADISFTCDSRIGAVTNGGLFTASKISDSGYVYVRYKSLIDSAFVVVVDIKKFSLDPKLVTVDTSKSLQFNVNAYDAYGVKQDMPLTELRWKSTDPSAGTVDSTGSFRGKKEGSTSIIATYGTLADTALALIEIGKGTSMLDAMDATAGWSVTTDHVDSVSLSVVSDPRTHGTGALKIDYSYAYDPTATSFIYLAKPIRIYGIPDSLFLDVRSNGMKHRLYYRFSDSNDELFRGIGRKYLEDTLNLNPIPATFAGMTAVTPGAVFNYPATIARIELQLAAGQDAGQIMKGSFYLDNLRAKYPATATGVAIGGRHEAAGYSLGQNYPNPFNPTTMIGFSIPKRSHVLVTVFDVLGRQAAVVVNGELEAGAHTATFTAAGLPSGMYFYTVRAGEYTAAKKMMILK